jgi:hypothetical protein
LREHVGRALKLAGDLAEAAMLEAFVAGLRPEATPVSLVLVLLGVILRLWLWF